MNTNYYPTGPKTMLNSISDVLSYTLSKAFDNNDFKTRYDISRNKVYHYTSSSILPLILKDDGIKIRFTDYRFLNDTSEGEELPKIFEKKLEELYKHNKISTEFYHHMAGQSHNITSPKLFVACFSTDQDSLPMWNYYLKNGKYEGYSLGFKFSDLPDYLTPLKIIYNDRDKEEYIQKMILSSYGTNNSLEERCNELKKTLQQSSLIMKNSCFKHEKEVRLLLNYDKVPSEEHIKIEYHSKDGIMQPYCDYWFVNKSFFKSCCFAPTMQAELANVGLTSFLSSNRYDPSKIAITSSKIPVRY